MAAHGLEGSRAAAAAGGGRRWWEGWGGGGGENVGGAGELQHIRIAGNWDRGALYSRLVEDNGGDVRDVEMGWKLAVAPVIYNTGYSKSWNEGRFHRICAIICFLTRREKCSSPLRLTS